jgi:hypothetical protein
MSSHTPGPWVVDTDTWVVEDNAHNPGQIAIISDRPERRANARLVEASPDLLAACEAFLNCPPRDRHDLHLEEIIRAAVADARGA